MKQYLRLCLLTFLVLILYNCTVTAQAISNGIKINAKGLSVKEAYLVFENDTKVPAGNKVKVNQKVVLKMILENGFKSVGGKVFPGGKEKVALSNGETIMESGDLFTDFDKTGVSAEAAKYIAFKAVITEIKDKKNYVIVSFKVWDKKDAANVITGSYKLYIQ